MEKLLDIMNKSKDVPLLFLRVALVYGYVNSIVFRIQNIPAMVELFEQGGVVLPSYSIYLVIAIECIGVLMLLFGYYTRFITLVLMLVLVIAIRTVHSGKGFSVADGGIEIVIYYLVMLFTLLVYGAGNVSIDGLRKKNK